jgi:hypothetical protein
MGHLVTLRWMLWLRDSAVLYQILVEIQFVLLLQWRVFFAVFCLFARKWVDKKFAWLFEWTVTDDMISNKSPVSSLGHRILHNFFSYHFWGLSWQPGNVAVYLLTGLDTCRVCRISLGPIPLRLSGLTVLIHVTNYLRVGIVRSVPCNCDHFPICCAPRLSYNDSRFIRQISLHWLQQRRLVAKRREAGRETLFS